MKDAVPPHLCEAHASFWQQGVSPQRGFPLCVLCQSESRQRELTEIVQALGRALGYPEAVDQQLILTGDQTATSIVNDAARIIREQNERIKYMREVTVSAEVIRYSLDHGIDFDTTQLGRDLDRLAKFNRKNFAGLPHKRPPRPESGLKGMQNPAEPYRTQ